MLGYLEKHCADAYRRESDQDENVIRSLPFFAAALTLELALLTRISGHLPPIAFSWYPIALYLLLVIAGAAVAATILLIYLATAQRVFRYTPPETQVVEWAINQRRAYVDAGFPRSEVDAVVEEELQEQLATEFAAAAEHNRANNVIRLRFRAYALFALITALLVALIMAMVIFGAHLGNRTGAEGALDEPRTEERSAERANTSEDADASRPEDRADQGVGERARQGEAGRGGG